MMEQKHDCYAVDGTKPCIECLREIRRNRHPDRDPPRIGPIDGGE